MRSPAVHSREQLREITWRGFCFLSISIGTASMYLARILFLDSFTAGSILKTFSPCPFCTSPYLISIWLPRPTDLSATFKAKQLMKKLIKKRSPFTEHHQQPLIPLRASEKLLASGQYLWCDTSKVFSAHLQLMVKVFLTYQWRCCVFLFHLLLCG